VRVANNGVISRETIYEKKMVHILDITPLLNVNFGDLLFIFNKSCSFFDTG